MSDDDIKALREALVNKWSGLESFTEAEWYDIFSPERMTRVLDEVERLRAELDRAWAERDAAVANTEAHAAAEVRRAVAERDALRADAERLRFFEQEAERGMAPNLVFDDDGNWCVSYTGMQPMPRGDGAGFAETVSITCIVGPHEWKPSLREAIDTAREDAAMEYAARKDTPAPDICGNCDTALPEGCGGIFRDDGKYCRLNDARKDAT